MGNTNPACVSAPVSTNGQEGSVPAAWHSSQHPCLLLSVPAPFLAHLTQTPKTGSHQVSLATVLCSAASKFSSSSPPSSSLTYLLFIYLCVCTHTCACTGRSMHVTVRTTFKNQFFPSTVFNLGIELGQAWWQTPSHRAISLAQILILSHRGDPAHVPKGPPPGFFSVFAG